MILYLQQLCVEKDGFLIEDWHAIKGKLKRIIINFAKNKSWKEKIVYEKLVSKMKWITNHAEMASATEKESLNAIKAKLVEIQLARCRAAAIRAKVEDFLQGEKYSGIF